MKRKISQFFDRREELSQIALNKKKYLLFMFFTGIFVGHRFYFKHYSSAIFYLPTCWSGFSFAMTLIDFLIVIPKQANKHGNIYL